MGSPASIACERGRCMQLPIGRALHSRAQAPWERSSSSFACVGTCAALNCVPSPVCTLSNAQCSTPCSQRSRRWTGSPVSQPCERASAGAAMGIALQELRPSREGAAPRARASAPQLRARPDLPRTPQCVGGSKPTRGPHRSLRIRFQIQPQEYCHSCE
jgi:hypothetical protein